MLAVTTTDPHGARWTTTVSVDWSTGRAVLVYASTRHS